MPTATQHQTTPTRRSAPGFSAAAVVTGLTAPVIETAPGSEAKLLNSAPWMPASSAGRAIYLYWTQDRRRIDPGVD
jgi:hypothetical protein